MPPNGEANSKNVKEAFLRAINVLGPETSRLLLYHLEHNYGISVEGSSFAKSSEIEAALTDVAGTGATLIIQKMREYMAG